MHGTRDAWQALEAGLRTPTPPAPADPAALAKLFGVPEADIRAALEKGWVPPRVQVG